MKKVNYGAGPHAHHGRGETVVIHHDPVPLRFRDGLGASAATARVTLGKRYGEDQHEHEEELLGVPACGF